MLHRTFPRRPLLVGAVASATLIAGWRSPHASAVTDYTTRAAFDSAWDQVQTNGLLPLTTDNNTYGILAWQTGYVMPALLQMYLTHGDTSYLDEFATFATGILAQRDDAQGRLDWRGLSLPGWSHLFTGSYPTPTSSCDPVSFSGRLHQTVETGMIARPLAWFARIVAGSPALQANPTYATLANECFLAAAAAIDIHEDDWIQTSSSAGTYSIPHGAAHPYDGMQTPYNMSHTLAHTQLHLAAVTTGPVQARYLARVASALELWRGDLPSPAPSGARPWTYHWSGSWGYSGWTCTDLVSVHHPSNPAFPVIEDPSHGALTADFVRQAFDDGAALTAGELSATASTFDQATVTTISGPRLAKYLDGTGTPNANQQYMAGVWACLAPASTTNAIVSTCNAIFNSVPTPTSKANACSWLHSISSLNRFA